MFEENPDTQTYWHSPERAWTPVMWVIGVVALALSTLLLAPLLPMVIAAH